MRRLWMIGYLVAVLSFNVQLFAADPVASPKEHAHTHDEHGPHGGELIDIGHGEYHAELLLNEPTQEVTIYLLDGPAKSFVAINSPSLVVNFKRAGKPVQVKLIAMPQEIDEKGFSSRYGMKSSELMGSLHDPKSDPRFSVRIANKSYIARLTHSHNHSHDHNHGTEGANTKK